MKTVVCLILALVLCVGAQDLHNQDLHRRHHSTDRQAASSAQDRRDSTSGRQGGRFVSSSGQGRQYVDSDGRSYFEYRPHVSATGGRGRSGGAGGTVNNRQTYDYPFGRGRINYASSGGNGHSNGNANDRNYSNSAGRRGSTTYTQQQQRRHYSSSGVDTERDGRPSQRAEYGTQYRSRSNQDGRRASREQRRTYDAGRSNSGQVYSRYHLSGPNGTSQGRSSGDATRTRYIRPGYGPDIRQRSVYGTADGQTYYGTAGGQRSGYGNTDGQRGRYGTGVYRTRTGRSQTTGGRTSTYSQAYRGSNTPDHSTRRRGRDECPQRGMELRIDGLPCDQAVRRHGLALCYTHEFSSRKCCQACRPRRNQDRPGCEYGDRTDRCSTIRPSDCYNAENRRICCQTCERLKRSDAPGCEYGDRSSRCDAIRRNPGLCYNAENQRVCCQSCSNLRDQARPDCPWGDHNAQLCTPFSNNTSTVRINCYSPRTRNLCCSSCRRLREWVPDDLPAGCEYGDQPVKFLAGQFGQLTCATYFNHFSSQHCALPDSDVARYCCYTCHRRLGHSRG